jgi:Nif-specific regulatory protein
MEDPDPLLEEALDLLLEVTSSRAGYIELRDPTSDDRRSWSADFGVDDAERANIERRISRGVIAEAVETGEVVHTASALLDERFAHRESVQREALNAVLCVPFSTTGAAGVVYLQDRSEGGAYGDQDVVCVQAIAEFLGTLSSRLLEVLRRRREQDHTSRVRDRLELEGLIGRSSALASVLERLEVLARMEANVLLSGPSGSGKSLFAKLLHQNSGRANAPFVALNCAALPETLVESELFGSEKGAHSTADQATAGKVAAAEGGTLFLDEVGELPIAVQAKVLQLVQTKEYYRLGGTRAITADVRIITATNRDLEEEIRNKTFRDDLYYRIRGLQLRIPPLVQRREDIPLLIAHYCEESCRRIGTPELTPSPAALAAAEFFEWPGNIRELASACEEAVINARLDGSLEIEPRHLFPTSEAPQAATFHEARQRWERSYLDKALHQQEWNVAKTARVQGMSRSHLNALIRRFDLRRDSKSASD